MMTKNEILHAYHFRHACKIFDANNKTRQPIEDISQWHC
jgi:hypothetical protein